MKRASSQSNESLDLLLDTICNTFGGVLFISMLVVILLNMSTETVSETPPTPEARRQMIRAQTELAESEAQLESLRRAAKQRQRLREQFTSSQTAQRLQQLEEIDQLNDSLSTRKNEDLQNLAATQEAINETIEQMHQLKETHRRIQSALSNVEAELEREIALRSRTAQLPKQRRTSKNQVAFLLKDGRLCSFAKVSNGNLVPNEGEVKLLTEGNKTYAEPVPSAGLVINPNAEDLSAIDAKLQPFDKEQFFLAIVVWPDSFPHFVTLKESMVRLGYEYQLVPWSGEERLSVGSTNEQGGVVQ